MRESGELGSASNSLVTLAESHPRASVSPSVHGSRNTCVTQSHPEGRGASACDGARRGSPELQEEGPLGKTQRRWSHFAAFQKLAVRPTGRDLHPYPARPFGRSVCASPLVGILISRGCRDKVPQAGRLQMTEDVFSHRSGRRSPKPSGTRATLLKALGENPPLPLPPPGASRRPWVFAGSSPRHSHLGLHGGVAVPALRVWSRAPTSYKDTARLLCDLILT